MQRQIFRTETIEEAFKPHQNSFCLLRCLLALGVIFSHAFIVGGLGPQPLEVRTNGIYTLGTVCVSLFFLLSGFLITRSYMQVQSCGRFLWHRALRILPAYWVCLIVTAAIFAPVMIMLEHQNPAGLLHVKMERPWTYVTNNWFVFQYQKRIACTLILAPDPSAINGSLWSLVYELFCYAAVAVLGVIGVLRSQRGLVFGLFAGLWVLHIFGSMMAPLYHACFPFLPPQVVGVTLYFAAGSTAYLYRQSISCSFTLLLVSIASIIAAFFLGILPIVAPLALSYVFLWLAFRLPFSGFERFGDMSYGLYIYAMPIQHILALGHVNKFGVTAYFGAAVVLTLLFAALSYRLIEAPALKLKNSRFVLFRKELEPLAVT